MECNVESLTRLFLLLLFAEGIQERPGTGSEGAGLIWPRPGGNTRAAAGEKRQSDTEPGKTLTSHAAAVEL